MIFFFYLGLLWKCWKSSSIVKGSTGLEDKEIKPRGKMFSIISFNTSGAEDVGSDLSSVW